MSAQKNPLEQLARMTRPKPPPSERYRLAVVDSIDPSNKRGAFVLLSGSASAVGPIPCLAPYFPRVGDKVWVVGPPASLMVLGTLDPAVDRGLYSGSTNSSGQTSLTHGLGSTPANVQILHQGTGTPVIWAAVVTSTTLTVTWWNPSGTLYASSPISFWWRVEG